jgi:hypothetical protein
MKTLLLVSVLLLCAGSSRAGDAVRFECEPQRVVVYLGNQPIATYVFADPRISRPYVCDLLTPWGKRITRHHPPIEGVDLTDHDTFHPGVWLSFGDLEGSDFWRLKAPVEHAGFVVEPVSSEHGGTFTVKNRYRVAPGGRVICEETCRYTWTPRELGYLLEVESIFASDSASFTFGDQEEMGLGIRMATPLIVRRQGTIINALGQRNEAQAWGQAADWCDYSGLDEGRRLGVVLMPSPRNFRPSWFHVRDYGLMAANPFGRNAMTGGEPSRVVIPARQPWRLAFGLLVYECGPDDEIDRAAAFTSYAEREQNR